jgi:hypothetical protein
MAENKINTLNTVAFKCPVCGSVEFNQFYLFDLWGKKRLVVPCGCKKGFVKITLKSDNKCLITVPCIACNEKHLFIRDIRELWSDRMLKLTCQHSGMDICFIGQDEIVRSSVDIYEMRMDILMNDIGYEDYFVNNTVMLNTIDRIHDIAEKGNLICECGSIDIELQMYYDRVELFCNKCHANGTIKAATNQDLKPTLRRESIVLCQDSAVPYKDLQIGK